MKFVPKRGGPATIADIDTDDVLANLAWGLIRDWRRRRDVDSAIRLAWVRCASVSSVGRKAARRVWIALIEQ